MLGNIRKSKEYQGVIIDLALAGAIDATIAEALLGYAIPTRLSLPSDFEKRLEEAIANNGSDDDDDDDNNTGNGGDNTGSGNDDPLNGGETTGTGSDDTTGTGGDDNGNTDPTPAVQG